MFRSHSHFSIIRAIFISSVGEKKNNTKLHYLNMYNDPDLGKISIWCTITRLDVYSERRQRYLLAPEESAALMRKSSLRNRVLPAATAALNFESAEKKIERDGAKNEINDFVLCEVLSKTL